MYIRREDLGETLEKIEDITSTDYSCEYDKSLITIDDLFSMLDDLVYEFEKKEEEIEILKGWKEEELPMSEREFH